MKSDEIETLRSKANSFDKIWDYVNKKPEFKEVRNDVLRDGNQGCAVMVEVFIEKLLTQIED